MDPEIEKLVATGRARGYSDGEIQSKLKARGIEWTPTAAAPDSTKQTSWFRLHGSAAIRMMRFSSDSPTRE